MSSFWVIFEASQASISLQISFIVTNLKQNQSEGFLAYSILRTLVCLEKFSMVLKTESSLESDNMGRSILRVSTIFSEWSQFFNIFFFRYNFNSVNEDHSLIVESLAW